MVAATSISRRLALALESRGSRRLSTPRARCASVPAGQNTAEEEGQSYLPGGLSD